VDEFSFSANFKRFKLVGLCVGRFALHLILRMTGKRFENGSSGLIFVCG
jgi:hypothetical protein